MSHISPICFFAILTLFPIYIIARYLISASAPKRKFAFLRRDSDWERFNSIMDSIIMDSNKLYYVDAEKFRFEFTPGLVDRLLLEADPLLEIGNDWYCERLGEGGIPAMWEWTSITAEVKDEK